MKTVLCLALLGACAAVFGQNPLEPSGFPLSPVKDQRLPPPLPADEAAYSLRLEAGVLQVEENEIHGSPLKFEFRGYRVTCDEGVGDLDTSQFVLRGNVNILGRDHVIRADSVFVDFENQTFRLDDGEMDLRAALMKGRLLSDLYVSALAIEGRPGRLEGHVCRLTTCEYDDPHYSFESHQLTAIPDKKLVFRNFRLRINGKTIFQVPKLVVPITRASRGFAPEVGQSRDEGFYMKLRYGVPVGNDTATIRADLMTRRGFGLGADYEYSSRTSSGLIQAYSDFQRVTGDISLTLLARHKQDSSWGRFEGSHETRQFNYLSGPGIVLHRTTLRFAPNPYAGGTTTLSYRRSENRSSFSRSVQSTLTLSDNRRWSDNHTTTLQLNLTESSGSSGGNVISSRRALDVRLRERVEFSKYVAELNYTRQVPIGSTVNFFSGIDRTPELTISTDRGRLVGESSGWPDFRLGFTVGSFFDHFTDADIIRYAFDLKVNRRSTSPSGVTLDYDLGLRQGFYSDGGAQYTPRANVRLSYKPTERLTANLRYNYMRPHGFTPLQLDRTGRYNTTTLDVLGDLGFGLRMGGQAGFDFNRDRTDSVAWQSPSVRLEYEPKEWFRFRGLANYDPRRALWSNLRFDVSWKAGATTFMAAARYDSRRNSWGSVNVLVDGLKWGRLKVSALMLYNGFLKRFDSTHLSFTYDLHCTEAILQIIDNRTGFRSGREILFFFRIKALPFDSGFGLGRFGQPLGLGAGRNW
ncbi:MAG: LPS-assembly protein LptD [Armatimonadetes bacterium]|nr:LPS-assembly protein LptD [Armatimonadota bacterium]